MLTNKVSVTSLEAEQSSVTLGFCGKIVWGLSRKHGGETFATEGGARHGLATEKGIPLEGDGSRYRDGFPYLTSTDMAFIDRMTERKCINDLSTLLTSY